MLASSPGETLRSGNRATGTATSLLYGLEPQWSISQLVADLVEGSLGLKPFEVSLQRWLIIAGLLLGMLGHSLYARAFSARPMTVAGSSRHLLAGSLMGFGSGIMLGGNDIQLFMVFPVLSPTALLPLASISLGIAVTSLSQHCWKRAATIRGRPPLS